MTDRYVNQKVWNPDFTQDLKRYLCSWMSDESLVIVLRRMSEHSLTTYEKLQTLVDRVEFVGHLSLVSAEARKHGFQFSGHEVRGIDWDIEALRLYLALTCVDIFATNFQRFDEWLVSHCGDFSSTEDIATYVGRKSADYHTSFTLSSNFAKAFLHSSHDLQLRLSDGLAVRKGNQICSDIPTIAGYLYQVRNKYTHEGRRFFSRPLVEARRQAVGPRDPSQLEIKPGFDLVDAVLSVAKEQAARILNQYAKQDLLADAEDGVAECQC